MKGLAYFYLLKNSQKDLISKNLYENINQISNIKHINLSFSKLRNKLFIILALAFLYLITNKKGRVILKSKFNSSKIYGCSLKLKYKDALFFLEKFLFVNLKNILDLEDGFLKSGLSDLGTFSFTVKDIYTFFELDENLSKLYILKNLNIMVLFSSDNKYENMQLLKSLGVMFKD